MQYTSYLFVTLYHKLPIGVDNDYTIDNMHFLVANSGNVEDKLYATGITVTQPTATVEGVISATVALSPGMSIIKLQTASTSDLDGSNIEVTTVARTIVTHVENLESIEL